MSSGDGPTLVLAGGEVLDRHGRRLADVAVRDATVIEVGQFDAVDTAGGNVTVLDASGCVISTGLVDLLADVAGPGQHERETPTSAARAAALGGYTTVLAASTAVAPIDSLAALGERRAEWVGDQPCTVLEAGAVTVGHRGDALAPIGELAGAGVVVFSDGGQPIADTDLLRHALEYGDTFGATFALHPEDPALGRHGVMHEGGWSSKLGLPGRSSASELIGVQRLLALVELTSARVLVHRVSTAAGLALVGGAADAGLSVGATTTAHHLALTDADCQRFDTTRRVDPPLRTAADLEALRLGASSGVVAAVASDHRPHTAQAKELPFDQAPAGVLGLETTLGVLLTHAGLELDRALALTSWSPAALLGLPYAGEVVAGAPADLCVIDGDAQWTVRGLELASRSHNSAFEGETLRGRVRHTIHRGRAVVTDEKGQW